MRRSARVGSSVWSVLTFVVACTVLPGVIGLPGVLAPRADAAVPAGTAVAGVLNPTNVAQLVGLTNRVGSDASGNAYLATPGRIWKVDATTGALTVIVGNGEVGIAADGTLATAARITEPEAITVDTDGTVYFAEGYRIRKVAPGGTITTVAGTGLAGWGTAGALAASQPVLGGISIALDSAHNLYFSQASSAHVGVRKVTASTGILSDVVSGIGAATSTCLSENGPAASVMLRNVPFQIAIDATDHLYLAPACDLSNRSHVLKITGTTSALVAGGGGAMPSPGVNALTVALPFITDLGVSPSSGDLYAVASSYSQIWRMTMAGLMYPVAGASGCHDLVDGQAATWVCTNQMAFGPGTSLWITNWGQFGALSPTTFDLLTPDRHPADGVAATSVGLAALGDLAVRGDGEVYVAEGTTGYLRTVTAAGLLATKAGNGDTSTTPGFGGVAAASPIGFSQQSLDVDAAGNLYLLVNDSIVAEVTTAGTLVRIAGTGQFADGPDGPAATTDLAPRAIAAAADGTVYVLGYHYAPCGMSLCSVGVSLRRVVAGNVTTVWTSASGTWPYSDLAVAPDGTVVLLSETGDLGRWSPSTGSVAPIPFASGGPRLSLRVDDRGDIYVSVPTGVRKIGPGGGAITDVYVHANPGNGMAIDVDAVGGLYVSHDGVIRKIPQVPGAPTDLAASRSGSSATLTWNPPAWTGGAPPSYRIEVSTDGGASWSSAVGLSQTTYTLDWLVTGTSYLFRVQSFNGAGFGGTTPAVAPVEVPSAPDLDLVPPGLEVSDSTPTPAQSVLVEASGFAPYEWVAVVLRSTPTLIGNVQADATGAVRANVTVPAGTAPGAHTLALVGDTSGNGFQASVTVVVADDGVATPTPPPATFTSLTPTRLFETRPTEPQGAIPVVQQRYGGDGKVLKVKVTGVAGVPGSGVGAVSLNVTAVFPVADGYVSVYPCGDRPLVASINYRAGEIVPNAVIAPVSPSGEVCFYSMVDTFLVADVNGWFANGAGFTAVPPKRLIETRPFADQGAIAVTQQRYGGDGNVLQVRIADVAGIPATGVAAVSINVTAFDPVADGFVTVYPCGTRPLAANVNYRAGEIVPNAVIAPLSASGEVCFYSMVDTHLIVDVNGWFASGSGFRGVTPARLFETRPGETPGAVGVVTQRYGGDAKVLRVKVTGVAGVPASGVGAVSLNVTAVTPVADGFVTVYPCGTRPLAANVNYLAGEIVPNAVIAPVSASGEVCVYSMVDTYLVADVNGWFGSSG